MALNYMILSDDNLEALSKFTGISIKELEKTNNECLFSDSKQVFWRENDKWFSVRIDGMYVHYGQFDSIIKQVIEEHSMGASVGRQVTTPLGL